MTKPDVTVYDSGSVQLVTPLTQAAREWVDLNLDLEGWQWLGNGFGCESRYLPVIVEAMRLDGLEVEEP